MHSAAFVLFISLLITCKTSEVNYNENSEDTVFNFNITHILFQSILRCGPEIICNKSMLTLLNIPTLQFDGTTRCERCLCNEECALSFPRKICCPDVYFRYGLRECQELNILSREPDYKYAVSSCPVGTDDKLSLECSRNRSRLNLLFNPPVSSNDSYVAYKNKYCASCNNASELVDWNVKFRCYSEPDFNYLSTYKEIIDLAIAESCDIMYLSPVPSIDYCDDRENVISTCNVSGTWTEYDEQIDKACRSSYTYSMGGFDIFRNIFCVMCNPPKSEDCGNSSSVYHRYNLICLEDLPPGLPEPDITPEPSPISYRTEFSLTVHDTTKIFNVPGFTCSQYQMFGDSQQCRNLTCFPGKHLINNTCEFLLPVSSNLRYAISLRISLPKFISANVTIYEALDTTKDWISKKLKSVLDTVIFFEDFILMAIENCNQPFYKLRDFYIYIKIYIPQNVQRGEIETKLLNLNETFSDLILFYEYLHSIRTSVKLVNISRSQESIFLPTVVGELDTTKVCVVFSMNTSYISRKARNIIVSSLLSCKQVILESNGSNEVQSSLREEFSFPGVNISFHSSGSTDNGGFRVCVQNISYFTGLQVEQPVKISTMIILTLVCLTVSLVSLVITFITYSLFSSLRTIPGLNNMCLILSLSLSQLLYVMELFFWRRLKLTETGFVVFLSLHNFSNLATLFWFQVCSFHMFRVFTSKTRSSLHLTQTKKIMIKYALYGFGFPAVITSVTIITFIFKVMRDYDYNRKNLTVKWIIIVVGIVPLIFVSMTNIYFYILTVYKIHSTPKVENLTGYKMHLSVYVKLFTLTGLSSLLVVIQMIIETTVLTYVVNILYSLQGLFIFLSYVCNRRVWRLYTDKYTKKNLLKITKPGNTSM